MKNCVMSLVTAAALLLVPMLAHAQYKNTSFELDFAGIFLTRPSIVDSNGAMLGNGNLPNRNGVGERLGGAINFKLHEDHWWFGARVNLGFFQFTPQWDGGTTSCSEALGQNGGYTDPPELGYDCLALENIGTTLGLQVILGPRYYFLTDKVRPYLQLAVSYMHLFAFNSNASDSCTVAGYCANGGAYSDVFLPHTNLFGIHLQPGIEFILVRDFALSLALDVERYLILNADGNFSFTFAIGMVFYG